MFKLCHFKHHNLNYMLQNKSIHKFQNFELSSNFKFNPFDIKNNINDSKEENDRTFEKELKSDSENNKAKNDPANKNIKTRQTHNMLDMFNKKEVNCAVIHPVFQNK